METPTTTSSTTTPKKAQSSIERMKEDILKLKATCNLLKEKQGKPTSLD